MNICSDNWNFLGININPTPMSFNIRLTSNLDVTLPTESGYTYNCSIDWGDGTVTTMSSWNDSGRTHTYANTGIYLIQITGTFQAFSTVNYPEFSQILTNFNSYGVTPIYRLAFKDSYQLTSIPTPTSVLAPITDFSHFLENTSVTTIPSNLFSYSTGATDFSYAFYNLTGVTSIPSTLFSGITSGSNFTNTFGNLTNTTGSVPTIWETYPTATGTSCFTNINTGVTNYIDIPPEWGGPVIFPQSGNTLFYYRMASSYKDSVSGGTTPTTGSTTIGTGIIGHNTLFSGSTYSYLNNNTLTKKIINTTDEWTISSWMKFNNFNYYRKSKNEEIQVDVYRGTAYYMIKNDVYTSIMNQRIMGIALGRNSYNLSTPPYENLDWRLGFNLTFKVNLTSPTATAYERAYFKSTNAISLNQWYNVVITYKKNNYVKMYVNGSLNYTYTIPTDFTILPSGTHKTNVDRDIMAETFINFGDDKDHSDDYHKGLYPFDGAIDDTCAWNKVLTDAEISDLYSHKRYYPVQPHETNF